MITREKQGAPEGVRVQGGGIELPCTVLCLWAENIQAKTVKHELRKQQ